MFASSYLAVVSVRERLRTLAIAVLVCAMLAPASFAAEIRWRSDNFSYFARNKPLKEFIREFAASQGLTAVIAPGVDDTPVSGRFDLTPQSVLDFLAMSFGLVWYYDGSSLYVYPAGEVTSEVVRLGSTTVETLQTALQTLNIADQRYPIAYDRKQNTALVSGPRRYVELVKQTAFAADVNETARSVAEIRVFRLRYAWAADFTYLQDGRDHRLPGVVSVLRDLYSQRRSLPLPAVSTRSSPEQERMDRVDRMRGLGMIRVRDDTVAGNGGPRTRDDGSSVNEVAVAAEAQAALAMGGNDLPQFQADGRMNAVVVRDRPERMAGHEATIRSLDVKPGLVEIEVRILEINADAIDSLGIDWRLHSRRIDAQFGRGNLPNLGFGTALTPDAPQASPIPLPPPGLGRIPPRGIPDAGVVPPVPLPDLRRGGVLTTVLGDAGSFLIARVNALAQDGKANILSSPRVITLDNVEAVMENISTFFVRVAGNLDVGLFNVSAGTSLRVTPLIVNEGGELQVKLAIRIEDGALSNQSVDQIPVVQRSTIKTQAFVNQGESLLLGGYKNEVRSTTEVGVPGLSAIPVLGYLFKYREKQTTRVERLFLLTPRVVSP